MDWLVGPMEDQPTNPRLVGCWKMENGPGEKLNEPKNLSTNEIRRMLFLFGCQIQLQVETL